MKIKRLLFLFSLPLLLAACTSYKNVPYLQNPEAVNDLEGTLPLYDAKIMPKDLLSITVNTTGPITVVHFMREVPCVTAKNGRCDGGTYIQDRFR